MKIDLAMVVALVAGGALWVEHGHRISLDAPPQFVSSAAAADCPDNDSKPYTATCLTFLKNGAGTTAAIVAPSSLVEMAASSPTSACPDNDNRPYSARCLRFLSGWLWRPEMAIGAPLPASK